MAWEIWWELQTDPLGHFEPRPFGPSDFESRCGPKENHGSKLLVSLRLGAKQVEEWVVYVCVVFLRRT